MLESGDPLALALLKSGGAGGYGAGPVLIQPPEQKMRMLMAQQLLGADPASARSKGEGLARVGQQLLGAFLARKSMDEAKSQRDDDSGLMAAALRSQDRTPTTFTDDAGNQQTIAWNKPDPSTMTTIMAQGSPQLQQQALAMALSDRQRQADIAAKAVRTLTPEEKKAAGYPDSAVVQRDAYGSDKVVSEGDLWQPLGGRAAPPAPGDGGAGGGTMTVPKGPSATPTGAIPMSPQARATIGTESGGNVDAKNPSSSATGPGQFIDSTWLDMMQRHAPGLIQGKSKDEILEMRSDSELAASMTDAYAKENDTALRSAGLEPTPQDLYLAHVFGPGGAATMMKADQRAPAANLSSRGVVAANQSLFFEKNGRPRTVAELRQLLGNRFSRNLPQDAPAVDPNAQATVQMAQASTGVMSDAAPASASPDQTGEWVRYRNRKTGGLSEFETNSRTGEVRPVEAKTSDIKDYEAAVRDGGFKGSFFDYQTALKKAGKAETNVTVNGDNSLQKGLGELTAKSIETGRANATSAASQIATMAEARKLLDSGIFSGTGANWKLALDKGLSAIDLSNGERSANTEAFVSTMGRTTLDLVKGLGAGSGISNADRDFAEKIAGGNIDLNEKSIRRIMDIGQRAAESAITRYNQSIKPILDDPNTPATMKAYLSLQQPTAPAQQQTPAETTKTVGGKTYVKGEDGWYEQP